jgi:hypothetical protein
MEAGGIRSARRAWLRAALAALALGLSLPIAGLRHARADIPGVVYYPGNGHYYKYFAFSGDSTAAKSAAQSMGGYLATLTDSAENQWVVANSGIGSVNSAWIGGSDAVSEGTWTWITGETWSYTNWNSGEPNNSGDEDSLAMYGYATPYPGTWNDAPVGYTNVPGYVVEWDADPNTPPPPAAPTNLTGMLLANNHVRLDWVDNATNEASFDIDRRASAVPFSNLANPAANTITYDDAAALAQTQYTYRVRASNGGGKSGWSNEVTVDVPEIPSAPLAPSGLQPSAAGPSSVTIQWTDNSDDETGFELQRKNAAGVYQYLTSLGADVSQYVHSGLVPDTTYSYRVRAVNGNGASAFAEGAATTSPTLQVSTVKADLKDSGKFAKDSIKVQALFDFLPASDAAFDPVAEGITIRAGSDAAPVTLIVPPGEEWKIARGKATWKSLKGSTPKYKVEVDLEGRLVKLTVSSLQLAVAPENPMRVSVSIGDDAGSDHLDWLLKKPGIFQFRE